MSLNKIKRFIFSKPKKQINLFKIFLSYIFKSPKIYGKPVRLMIEPTNICNLRCKTCPVGTKDIKKKPGHMSFNEFKKIIDEVGDYLYHITLWNWGEPFLNPELGKMIEYARRKNIYVVTSTNGHFLDDKSVAEKIIKSSLNELIIALDGLSQETLEKYRERANFNKVIRGIKLLVNLKKKYEVKRPIIELQFIVMKHNQHELAKAREFAKNLGIDKLIIKTFGAQLDIKKLKEFEPTDKKLSRYGEEEKNKIRKSCRDIWLGININYDGNVVPCCYDPFEKYILGNVFKDGVIKVWQGKKLMNFRKAVLKNKNNIDICKNCDFNQGISRKINL